MRRPRGVDAAELVAVVAVLVAVVAVHLPTLGQPLTERHAFRQTQTAYTSLLFHEHGIDLLHPQLPVLGRPFEVPFEFPLFQAGASLLMDAGVAPDRAMRVTGLVCFLLTAALLYVLVRRVSSRVAAYAALVAFVASPFAVVWSRTSMIEYLATAGAVGWVAAGVAWRAHGGRWWYAGSLLSGAIGWLVKPPSVVFWALPLLLYRPRRPADRSPAYLAALGALLVVPAALGVAWTEHADAVKAASPWTASQTTSALQAWNFGTVSQRLALLTWKVIAKNVVALVTGWPGALLLAIGLVALVRRSDRWFWVGIVLCALAPPLVFTNLYYVHDYYLAAITPAVAAVIGLGVEAVWSRLPSSRRRPPLAVAGGTVVVVLALVLARGYWLPIFHGTHDPEGVLPIAAEVRSVSRPGELVAFDGFGWSPAVLYYARRRGMMILGDVAGPRLYADLRSQGYRVYGDNEVLRPPPALLPWPWVAGEGAHTYRAAATLAGLGKPVVAAGPGARGPRSSARRAELTLACGRGAVLRASAATIRLRLRAAAADAVLELPVESRAVPARRTIVVRTRAGSSVRIDCSGARSLVVERIEGARPAPG